MASFREQGTRSLSFLNLHTGESLTRNYWAGGYYDHDALRAFDEVLRDHRTGESYPMDRALFDVLHRLAGAMDISAPFHVISGYRSPRTNATLAGQSRGVSRRSLHMAGMAIDVRMPGRRLHDLRRAAAALDGGGVGYYPKPGFIHIDTGRVRFW